MNGCHIQLPFYVNKRQTIVDFFLSYTVPGWSRVEQYARDTWGTGDLDIIINPPGVSDPYLLTKVSMLKLQI